MAHDAQVTDNNRDDRRRRTFNAGDVVRGLIRKWNPAGYGFVWIDGLGSVLLPVHRIEIHRAPQVGDLIEMTLDLDRWNRWYGRDGHVIG